MDSSSKDSQSPHSQCPHQSSHPQQHQFKQEIEESIRRCEELLSMAPVLYHPSDGKSSGRRSSNPSARVSQADTGSSSIDFDRRSVDVDPEWKKNMSLLINIQDGNVTNVTPIARDSTFDVPTPLDEHGEPPTSRVETEYNLSFSESRDTSGTNTIPQSISITTRTVTHDSGTSNLTSASEDWHFEKSGHPQSPSSASRSSAKAASDEDAERVISNESHDLDLEGDRFSETASGTESGTYSERDPSGSWNQSERCASGSVTHSEREQMRAERIQKSSRLDGHSEGRINGNSSELPFQVVTTQSSHGNYNVSTTKRCATFPLHRRSPSPSFSSPISSISLRKPKSPRSSHSSRSETPKYRSASPPKDLVVDNEGLTFTFTTPQVYEDAWEWVGECSGVTTERGAHQFESAVIHEVVDLPKPGFVNRGVTQRTKGVLSVGDGMPKRFKMHPRKVRNPNLENRKSPGVMQGGRGVAQVHMHGRENREMKSKPSGPTARLRHLSKPRTDLYQRLAHTRAQLEEEHMSECSFKPKVGRRPNPQSQYSTPLIHRVTGIEQRVDLRKRARKVIEKEELDQCSFWPQINSNSEYLDLGHYKPIEERAMEHQRRREAKIARARAVEDKEMGLTFRPEINPKSVQIFKQTGLENINISDRLTNAGSLHSDSKAVSARVNQPKNECTFTPEINRNTDIIIKASKLLEGCTPDFLSRQQYLLRRAEMKKREKEQKLRGDNTFKPMIDANSDAILKTSPIAEVFNQPIYKRVDRLYHRDSERRQHIRRKISDAYYAQFTHHPAIDHTSRLLGRSSSAYDLYKNERGQKMRERIKSVIEDNFEKDHPFRPKLIASSPRRPSAERMEDILHRRRQFRLEKARVLEEMKLIRELKEFKECTFKPKVNQTIPKDQEPVVVKGLGRHLELQDLAKQMKRDQEEWERKIFFQHVYALPKRQYTIPKPFTFRGTTRASKAYASPPEQRRSACTVRFSFRNKTKEQNEFVDFYEASHPTPKNPRWKDTTIWSSAEVEPRFDNSPPK